MSSNRIFVSTGGERARTAVECGLEIVQRTRHGVELSGGKTMHDPEHEVPTLAGGRHVLLHNYFPPPEVSFVLNIAEPNPNVAEESMALVRRALLISGASGAKHFAVHAGFLSSPPVSELGKRIQARPVMDRDHGLELMVNRLLGLADVAEAAGVRLLVENHVLSTANLESFGQNFLLMVDPAEMHQVHDALAGRVGLLLDVGHLNVSAMSLGFDAPSELPALNAIAEGYHLSMNDGLSDQHGSLSASDWFWTGITRDKAFYTVEIHGPNIDDWIASADIVEQWLDGADQGMVF